MSDEEKQLIILRGIIASMPAGEQLKVKQAEAELRAVVLKHGDHGLLAAALICAEEAAKP